MRKIFVLFACFLLVTVLGLPSGCDKNDCDNVENITDTVGDTVENTSPSDTSVVDASDVTQATDEVSDVGLEGESDSDAGDEETNND